MKVVIQAFIGSIIIHALYMGSAILVGAVKTTLYKPDVVNAWEQVGALQNETAFGKVMSPSVYSLTFLWTALICGIVILSYKKIVILKQK
ncbi:hypothetical protein SRABI96_03090 [Peribacillus sp. Bi96]|uniref:hypothetical protein n=1 Tax=Peribacillus sp. Bi96 TaxID=2884273 RepID=UPI001D3E8DE4|nr:hypothetical protein [Peribacillus sp. Bi96]CAH0247462.1 hypothetical protein SRABI96_03090 [Peribacillus sp. Bi96]